MSLQISRDLLKEITKLVPGSYGVDLTIEHRITVIADVFSVSLSWVDGNGKQIRNLWAPILWPFTTKEVQDKLDYEARSNQSCVRLKLQSVLDRNMRDKALNALIKLTRCYEDLLRKCNL